MATTERTPGEESFARFPSDTVDAFTKAIAGEILVPSSPAYEVWNGMIDRYPAVTARCTGVADVVTAVRFAREQELEVTVRGGGHNVAGTALNDGGMSRSRRPVASKSPVRARSRRITGKKRSPAWQRGSVCVLTHHSTVGLPLAT